VIGIALLTAGSSGRMILLKYCTLSVREVVTIQNSKDKSV